LEAPAAIQAARFEHIVTDVGSARSGAGALAGRTAVVTGASSGIGRAIAEAFGAEHAHVVLAGRSLGPMEESAGRISAAGGTAEAHVVNVRVPSEVSELVAQAASSTGRLDVMVNNAGVSYPEAISSADPEHWREMLETNVLGLLAGCQAAVRAMREVGGHGYIVNISSIAAHRPDSGVYGSTKHAVNCISNTLRQELIDEPIDVVTVMPGAIATSFARNFDPAVLSALASTAGAGPLSVTQGEQIPDEVLAAARASLPDHLCTPEDVADAVVYCVTRRPGTQIGEIVVRPKKDFNF
jgi:NADP-dependent 3-hydroxy acid dehydrogenase YdfG